MAGVGLVLLFSLFAIHANGASTERSDSKEKPLKPFQLSIFPMLGTDGTDVINNRYRVSLNLFAGITGGIEGFEAAYFMNITRGNFEGFQAAGFMNIVSGNADGFQAAGFGNVMRGNSSGFQGSGFMNVVHGDADGARGAGFMNVVSGQNEGLMAAGFMNAVGKDAQGIAAAGFGNFYRGNVAGISAAGFMNTVAGQADGIYLAGFANAHNKQARGMMVAGFGNFGRGLVQGTQLAGFMNTSGDIQGLQVSGFLNIAKKVEGIQLGVINLSDTISGIPIGFLSITRKGGLRQFEASASDAMIAGLSLKIGVPVFYNIFSIGHLPMHKEIDWATGYGFGSNIQFTEQHRMQIELHNYRLQKPDSWWDKDYENNLNELRVLFSKRNDSNLEWFAGPVLYHQYLRDSTMDHDFDDHSVAPYSFFQRTRSNSMSQWWAGARAGIRWVMR